MNETEKVDRYAELERRYDGPRPQAALDAIGHGSTLDDEIARTEREVAYFRREFLASRASARRWFHNGNREMHGHNQEDARLYLDGYQDTRLLLRRLRGERASVKNAQRVIDTIMKVTE